MSAVVRAAERIGKQPVGLRLEWAERIADAPHAVPIAARVMAFHALRNCRRPVPKALADAVPEALREPVR